MKKYVYVGNIVGTHGIKGEIRIISDSEIKLQVFKPDFNIYIGPLKEKHKIISYRHHKNFEMITLEGFDNINDVLKFKNLSVYASRDDLKIDDYLLEDLYDLEIIEDNISLGKVIDVIKNGTNILLKVSGTKTFYIPKVDEYIIKIDLDNKKIIVKNTRGLML